MQDLRTREGAERIGGENVATATTRLREEHEAHEVTLRAEKPTSWPNPARERQGRADGGVKIEEAKLTNIAYAGNRGRHAAPQQAEADLGAREDSAGAVSIVEMARRASRREVVEPTTSAPPDGPKLMGCSARSAHPTDRQPRDALHVTKKMRAQGVTVADHPYLWAR